MDVQLERSWRKQLAGEFAKPYFSELTSFVQEAYASGVVYPAYKNIFSAFEQCPFEKTRVVILGQDPYHGEGQANGLAFAMEEGKRLQPSIRNIFKEIEAEFGQPMQRRSGDLSHWAQQGVFLLNSILTVDARTPGSHQNKGWEEFTDAAVAALSHEREHVVFMLWGNYAKAKGAHIDRSKHLVLEAAHPAYFTAHKGFFGCGHFKKANEYLKANGLMEIDWL